MFYTGCKDKEKKIDFTTLEKPDSVSQEVFDIFTRTHDFLHGLMYEHKEFDVIKASIVMNDYNNFQLLSTKTLSVNDHQLIQYTLELFSSYAKWKKAIDNNITDDIIDASNQFLELESKIIEFFKKV
jgi:hypothetical protein